MSATFTDGAAMRLRLGWSLRPHRERPRRYNLLAPKDGFEAVYPTKLDITSGSQSTKYGRGPMSLVGQRQ
jgi:hypothetical protein